MKKIFVPIKRVLDWQLKVKPNAEGSDVDKSNAKWIINTFDEIAVEEALRIRDAGVGFSEVVLACIGPTLASEQIRSALAMGADRAVHVICDENLDSEQVAYILSSLIKRDSYDLILMGKQAIDSDSSQTGVRLAHLMNLPLASFASKVLVEGEKVLVTREVDGGLEQVRLTLPAIVTTDLRLNEPRLRSLPGIVAAKKKPIEEVQLIAIEGHLVSKTLVKKLELPPKRGAGKKVDSVDELVNLLKNEAKVI
jgi:electron transfer flavoprotein beta subunit